MHYKRNIFSVACLIIAAVVSSNCSHVEIETVEDFGHLDAKTCFIPSSTKVLSSDSAILDCYLPGGNTVESMPDDDILTKTTSTNGTALFKTVLSNNKHDDIIDYSGNYWSTDEHGDPILLSGCIVLPKEGRPTRLMIVNHFTIGANDEAPSREVPVESIFASKGLAVVCADYLGYGISSNRVHPYLCYEVTNRNVIDLFFAAMNFLDAIGKKPENDDVFIFGYSQGAAVSMSVAQELQKNHPDIDIRLTMCGSGPYDICATYNTLIENDKTDYPCAIPMIIQGMNVGLGLNIDYSDFFIPRMIDNLDTWINDKNFTMAQITEAIGSKSISAIMTETARNKATDTMTMLYKAMVDNSVLNYPIPDCPFYMFHSYDDNVVPYINTYNAKVIGADQNIIYNCGHYGNHVAGYLRFLFSSIDLLNTKGDLK